jgi:hypothetical protein
MDAAIAQARSGQWASYSLTVWGVNREEMTPFNNRWGKYSKAIYAVCKGKPD